MISQQQNNRFSKLLKKPYYQNSVSVFQPMNTVLSNGVRKMGFISEGETEYEARQGIVILAANHAAKTGENVLDILDAKRVAA